MRRDADTAADEICTRKPRRRGRAASDRIDEEVDAPQERLDALLMEALDEAQQAAPFWNEADRRRKELRPKGWFKSTFRILEIESDTGVPGC